MVASNSDLACVYAALILADDGHAVTADKLSAIISAAGVKVESYYPALFAKAASQLNVDEIVTKMSSATPSAAPAAGHAPAAAAAAPAAAAKEEPKKQEEEEEESAFDLFG
mmetsp:Transcript_4241/g.7764  ORF Transcript_4241/g.7764 Transcript_4241/m.7764 type:complete len:111 (-) Transcript_4241:39-371(-)|eukprot:CAMPEP_0184691470 /NCGR_PEP_ID=MMETSP0313-20130426/317_1 /TAXON_ID=2792 /ORGANISM="Porphyridium aerugineum, Strain SAG 1380-2" /LENGTH=110 /DNA_ID=CAMNT_0027149195 /DNA_START=86 /DNA_END=418 /DNA_ORIENTATION=-